MKIWKIVYLGIGLIGIDAIAAGCLSASLAAGATSYEVASLDCFKPSGYNALYVSSDQADGLIEYCNDEPDCSVGYNLAGCMPSNIRYGLSAQFASSLDIDYIYGSAPSKENEVAIPDALAYRLIRSGDWVMDLELFGASDLEGIVGATIPLYEPLHTPYFLTVSGVFSTGMPSWLTSIDIPKYLNSYEDGNSLERLCVILGDGGYKRSSANRYSSDCFEFGLDDVGLVLPTSNLISYLDREGDYVSNFLELEHSLEADQTEVSVDFGEAGRLKLPRSGLVEGIRRLAIEEAASSLGLEPDMEQAELYFGIANSTSPNREIDVEPFTIARAAEKLSVSLLQQAIDQGALPIDMTLRGMKVAGFTPSDCGGAMEGRQSAFEGQMALDSLSVACFPDSPASARAVARRFDIADEPGESLATSRSILQLLGIVGGVTLLLGVILSFIIAYSQGKKAAELGAKKAVGTIAIIALPALPISLSIFVPICYFSAFGAALREAFYFFFPSWPMWIGGIVIWLACTGLLCLAAGLAILRLKKRSRSFEGVEGAPVSTQSPTKR